MERYALQRVRLPRALFMSEWIKWVKGLENRREVVAMAIALRPTGHMRFDRDIIASAWMRVWSWADDETADGHIEGANAAFVDSIAGLEGFFREAEVVKWARSTERGISFANWGHHNGATAKARAWEAKRKAEQRHRSQTKPNVPEMSGPERDNNRDTNRDQREIREREEGEAAVRQEVSEMENTQQQRRERAILPAAGAAAKPPAGQSTEDRLRWLGVREPALSSLLASGVTLEHVERVWREIQASPSVRNRASVLVTQLCSDLRVSIPKRAGPLRGTVSRHMERLEQLRQRRVQQ